MAAVETETGIPNLDAMTPAALRETEDVFRFLASYCVMRRLGHINRHRDRLPEALRCDGICNSIYQQLPEWARW
jgi:hypothetical protein